MILGFFLEPIFGKKDGAEVPNDKESADDLLQIASVFPINFDINQNANVSY